MQSYSLLGSLLRIVLFFPRTFFNRANIRNNKRVSSSENCCILGNGPSLLNELQLHISQFQQQTLFVVNTFGKSEYYTQLKPSYYLLIDPVYWAEAISDEWNNDKSVIADIVEKTDWKLCVIVPFVAYGKLKSAFKSNPNITVLFYNHTILSFNKKIDFFFYKHGLATPVIQNVIACAMFNAINLKYKNIFLFGADHSWLADIGVDNTNRVCWVENHFYGSKTMRPFLKGTGVPYKMSEILFDYAKMFYGYQVLEAYSKYNSSEIINCTLGSFIDSFARKGF